MSKPYVLPTGDKARIAERIQKNPDKKIVFLTGAGVSAESGIPTFRGKEGYWTIGAKEYQPMTMATYGMFSRHPEEVWNWYLYRRASGADAMPNAGHYALSEASHLKTIDCQIITQNVDNLHHVAKTNPEKLYEIHGNITKIRCVKGCHKEVWDLPITVGQDKQKQSSLTVQEAAQLKCPKCGQWARPNILWCDEMYEEYYYKDQSAQSQLLKASILCVVGTMGATNLPYHIVKTASQRDILLIDINIVSNELTDIARAANGIVMTGKSGTVLPQLVEFIKQCSHNCSDAGM